LDGFEPLLLDGLDLLSKYVEARQVAADLGQSIGWERYVFRCAQDLDPCLRAAKLRLEVSDTQAHEGSLHAVNNAGPLTDETLALASWSLGILFI
jgi:hypothetical protein